MNGLDWPEFVLVVIDVSPSSIRETASLLAVADKEGEFKRAFRFLFSFCLLTRDILSVVVSLPLAHWTPFTHTLSLITFIFSARVDSKQDTRSAASLPPPPSIYCLHTIVIVHHTKQQETETRHFCNRNRTHAPFHRRHHQVSRTPAIFVPSSFTRH